MSPPRLRLTAAHIAKVHRIEPDEGPRPHLQQMDEADYHQHTHDIIKAAGEGPLRIFAYGSLIWRPDFTYTDKQLGTAYGWHRSFCMKIERWRGTRSLPGLMMALDRGGSCTGVVFTLEATNNHAEIDRLLRREMTNKPATNVPRWLTIHQGTDKIKALSFTACRSAYSYNGKLPAPQIAQTLARAAGHWGSGAEYLLNTVTHLAQHGIHDRNLDHLQKLVAEEIETMAQSPL